MSPSLSFEEYWQQAKIDDKHKGAFKRWLIIHEEIDRQYNMLGWNDLWHQYYRYRLKPRDNDGGS